MERRPKRRPRPELEVENEPELVEATTHVWNHRLFVPATWPAERRAANLELWMRS